MQVSAPCAVRVGGDPIPVESLVGQRRVEPTPAINGATAMVSKRFPGTRTNRTRLPSATVNTGILVVQPPLDLLGA